MSLQPIDYYDCDKLGLKAERSLQQREFKAMDLIRRHVPDNPDVHLLDIGCGDGFFLQELDRALKRDYNYHGVDYSEYKVKKASKLPYEFRRCNLEEGIPYPDATFDVVYSGEVIEHIYNPDYMLEECRRVLKPDGLLILSTPNLHAWYNRMLFLFGVQPFFYEVSTRSTYVGAGPLRRFKHQEVPVGHLRVFNRTSLVDLLKNEAFKPISIKGSMFPAFPKPLQIVDNAFTLMPSLASNLIVAARRGEK